ncbi:hypothetical protein BV20DRAFT_1036467 [Pilatotrama ljubarskyi]|nr:hypothetical protein BV20DRAFT_1036467 [Pilatotrama ljubarskyi]
MPTSSPVDPSLAKFMNAWYWASPIHHSWPRKLPLLLWERILDQLFVPIGDDYWYPTDLRSCAAVCRAWRPRARYNLWRGRLLDLIRDDAHLCELIVELEIYPDRPGCEWGSVSFFLPELTRVLPNLRFMWLKRVNWLASPYAYNAVVARFRSLTTLRLWFASFETATDFFRLVWSLRNLRNLIVHRKMFIRRALSEGESRRLAIARKPWACRELFRLDVGHLLCEEVNVGLFQFPPPGAFGSSVTSLSLHPQGSRLPSILENVSCYIRDLKNLRSIELSVRLSAIMVPAHPEDMIQDSVLLLYLVTNLPSAPSMHSISLCVSGMSTGSRSRLLDVLVGTEDSYGPLWERVPSLQRLHFRMEDVGRDHASWWRQQLSKRLPSVSDLVQVEVQLGEQIGYTSMSRDKDGWSEGF